MRNKFSELIEQGIAQFNYTPILQETTCNDPICREYNNIFGPAMDTHMSMLEDGTRVITGHRIDDEQEWTRFVYSTMWNGVDFIKSGYNTLNEFLGRFNLTFRKTCLNGDVVMKVVEFQEPTEMPTATKPTATNESIDESLNIFMVTNKKTNKSYIVIANDEKESIDLVPDTSKDDLKSSKVNANVPRNIKKPIIVKDSDQVINESENLMESKDCIACDKETVKKVMQDLKDEGYDISVIHDILSDNYKELDSLISKPNKLLLKFVLGINPKPGKHLDIEGSINAAKKAWKNK